MRHRLSPAAIDDLLDIFVTGIDRFGIGQAAKYREGLERTFVMLATFPAMGPQRLELVGNFRVFAYKAHVVIYRHTDDEVIIVRIRHAHEDWL